MPHLSHILEGMPKLTFQQVEEIRKTLSDVEEKINLDTLIGKPVQNEEAMKRQLEKAGDDFLK